MAVETSTKLTIQVRKTVRDWLDRESTRLDQPIEEFAATLVEEAMRMEQFPGIYFVGGSAGRRARLMGSMDVWEMIMIYRDFGHEHGRADLLAAYDFSDYHIDRALAYYAAYPDEINDILEENSQPPEYWMAKYPEVFARTGRP